ncbi:MAG: imidazole glycerol phosphate synthase subunit HisH [Deltaproteobacteria bacterium]|nr:imidazole glycerol phosphate synthase subunit HisH [Deltaproteobacteria bacterium]
MIAIIDYSAGNLTSVERALRYIGFESCITNDITKIKASERIIFPGVGAAGSAMDSLIQLGIDRALKEAFSEGKPILGICLGSQIILGHSEENETSCLGIISGLVRAFPDGLIGKDKNKLKIPHMGWNQVEIVVDHPILEGIKADDEFYFVHGYYPNPDDSDHVIGFTEYGIQFPSVIGSKNLLATQFHLEKSGRPGLKMLKNFSEWQPC